MNAQTLLETIGDARPEYVQKAKPVMEPGSEIKSGKSRHHKLRKNLLIAAILLVILLAACAAAGNWFVDYYRLNGPITPEQEQFIEAHSRKEAQSVTVDGYTIQLQGTFGDSSRTSFLFAITAPEGVDLEHAEQVEIDLEVTDPEGETPHRETGGVEEDHDGKANTIFYVWEIESEGKVKWQIHMENLYLESYNREFLMELERTKYKDQPDHEYTEEEMRKIDQITELCAGPWDFQVTLDPVQLESLEIIQEPVLIHTEIKKNLGTREMADVHVVSFCLQPLSARMELDESVFLSHEASFELTVVMEDGSEIPLILSSTSGGVYQYAADAPILLDKVAKIVLPDGTEQVR